LLFFIVLAHLHPLPLELLDYHIDTLISILHYHLEVLLLLSTWFAI
jgi:hypothetical protein